MSPTPREFATRCWEFRPSATGVLIMTGATLVLMFAMGWPAWSCVLFVFAISVALAVLLAALELYGEASEPPAGSADEAEAADS